MHFTMKTFDYFKIPLLLIVSLTVLASCDGIKKENKMKPPIAEKIETKLEKHGDVRIDNYYWMNERENPKVKEYLDAENAYLKAELKHTEDFQEKLFNEIKGRIKETDMSVPYKKDGYFYYSRFEQGKDYPIYCRKKESMENPEEIMLNVNEMAEGFEFYQVGGMSVSTNNNLLAFAVDTIGRRQYTIHFKNLETGDVLEDNIPNTTGSVTWANDNTTIFYNVKDEALRPYKVFRHKLGINAENDVVVYHEKDETFHTFMYKTKSKKYIFFGSSSTLTSESSFIEAGSPDEMPKVFIPREKDHIYLVSHFNDKFYIKTNKEAKNFKLISCPVDNYSVDYWEDVIPHRDDVLLESIEIFKDYLVVNERKNGLAELRVIKWGDWTQHYISFEEETYTAYIGTNPDFDSEILRFGYTSMTTPSSVFDYNMKTKERTLLKQQEVLGYFKVEDYEAKRLYAEARDGVKVPISLVYKKGIKLDGTNPTLLYAYGSYGHSIDPYFSVARLSLLNRGFVFAIAHIRGGQELGRQWYEDGKLLKKKNTFFDFIDCAKYLIDQKYTSPEKLFAMGGSAGGLLMGAVANYNPELFEGVIAQVPFVDVITTMLDESIPLTTGEYDEWGNPNDKEYYDYMLSYSPYDNVEAKDYPNILVTTGFHDSQVQYWEPAKWVAKLRDMKTDDNKLLFYINMDAGHGGASGRFKPIKETALVYAFMFDLLKIYE
jgi:oligopeptidase B